MHKQNFTVCGLLLAMIISAFSCNSPVDEGIPNIELDAALEKTSDFKLSDIVSDAEIIMLDTIPDAYFINAGGLTITDNYICFACDNQKRVYLFTREGKFIRHIGRVGKGPGEFVWPNNVALSPDEKHVLVVDMDTRKILLYDINGGFLKERIIKDDTPGYFPEQVLFADNENILVSIRRPGTLKDAYSSILNYNLKLEVVSNILQKPIDPDASFKDQSYHALGTLPNGNYFWETMMDTIYSFDLKGNEKAEFVLNMKDKTGYLYNEPDQMKMIISTTVLPNHIQITSLIGGKSQIFIYDKTTGETSAIRHAIDCQQENNSWVTQSIPNDVYGVEPAWLGTYDPGRNIMYTLIRPGWTAQSCDLDCIREKKVTHPEVRDQYLEISENCIDQMQAAILIMKIKN